MLIGRFMKGFLRPLIFFIKCYAKSFLIFFFSCYIALKFKLIIGGTVEPTVALIKKILTKFFAFFQDFDLVDGDLFTKNIINLNIFKSKAKKD